MTLSEAMFDLQKKGLPYPSPLSVFFLYNKNGDNYQKNEGFEARFNELLKMQKTIIMPGGR